MKNWQKTSIGEIAFTTSGSTPSREDSTFFNGDIAWVKTGELHQKYVFDSDEKITHRALALTACKVYPKETILLAMYGATIGQLSIAKIELTSNQACCAIYPSSKYSTEFLYYSILFHRQKLIEQSSGAAQPNINQKIIKNFEILLPCIDDQNFIAKVLITIDQAIEKTEHLIAKYERIKTGLMQDLLTRGIDENGHIRTEGVYEFKDSPLGRIPKEWEVDKMGKWVDVKGGFAFQSSDFTKNGIQLLRIGNLFNNQLDLLRSPIFLPESFLEKLTDFSLKKNDIVMSMTGTYGKRDYGFAILIENGIFLMNQRLCKFVFDNNIIDNLFLLYLLRSEYYLDELFKSVTGSKQGNLKNSNILDVKIALPKIDEQRRISDRILNSNKILEEEKRSLEKLKKIKTGLMQDLLIGKVRVDELLKTN